MTLSLTLQETTVEVVAGGSTPVPVLVENRGPSPVRVVLELGGRAAAWLHLADATASDVPLGPGESRTLTLRLSPPRGAAVPGQLLAFRVRAAVRDDPAASAVATGLVLISAPVPVTARLEPTSARTTSASHHVVELTTEDPTGVLVTLRGGTTVSGATVTVDPVAVRVEPGGPARAAVTVRPRHPALRSREHVFEVVWETDGTDGLARGTLGGRLVQPPVLPPVVAVVLAVALVLLLGSTAAALWPERSGAGASAAVDGTPQPPDGAPPPPPAAGADVPVVVHSQFKAPDDPEGSRADAAQRGAALRLPPGARVEVVDSSTVQWVDGYWLVVVRGLGDRAAADFCRTPPAGVGSCRPLR